MLPVTNVIGCYNATCSYVILKQVISEYMFECKVWISKWFIHFGSTFFFFFFRFLHAESCLKHMNKTVSDYFLLFVGMVTQLPWR